MNEQVSLSSIAQRNTEIVDASIDGETVMMSIENGQYYGLDQIGSHIWSKLETPQKVEELCQELGKEYDVTEQECQKDVLQFLNTLSENGIIEVTDC